MINSRTKYIFEDGAISELISADTSLKNYYLQEFKEWYPNGDSERLFYIDIAHISRYVVECFKTGRTDFFDTLFDKVEHILLDCSPDVENLIVVGLFEGIQNNSGQEIDYHTKYDPWLRPMSKIKWDKLIDGWEGKEWRKS